MSQEVHGLVFGGYVKAFEARGLSREELLAGLNVRREALEPPYGWCDWDDLSRMVDRALELLGGAWQLEQAAGEAVSAHPVMRVLASAVLSPRRLYCEFAPWVIGHLFRCGGVQARPVGGDKVLVRIRMFDGYRPSLAASIATLGVLRHYPELIGAPPALVEADLTPAGGDFLVTLPASSTLPARIGRALGRLGTEDPVRDFETLREALQLTRLDPLLRAHVDRVGPEIASARDAAEVFDRLAGFLARHFCCQAVWLWGREPESRDLVLVGSRGTLGGDLRSLCTRALAADGEDVGRVQADMVPPEEPGLSACYQALLSWTAVGLRATAAPPRPETRPQRAEPAWLAGARLTPRQRQVLDLLVKGLANKEIASELGCSVKTVEVHVGQVLRKSGTDSRAGLAFRYWQDGSRQSA